MFVLSEFQRRDQSDQYKVTCSAFVVTNGRAAVDAPSIAASCAEKYNPCHAAPVGNANGNVKWPNAAAARTLPVPLVPTKVATVSVLKKQCGLPAIGTLG